MVRAKYYTAVEEAQKEYDHHKDYFKSGVCGYFIAEGAPREKLAECLQGVVKVSNGEDVAGLFSERHHSRVRIFARQYKTVQRFEQALDNAKAALEAAEQVQLKDFHEV